VLLLVAVALVAAGVGALFESTHALRRLELSTIDIRFDLRGTQSAPPDVVIVGVDEKTLSLPPKRYPLDRVRYAKVIDALNRAGAAVIAYDIEVTESSSDAAADGALYEAASKTKRAVFGTTEVASDGSTAIFGGGDALKQSGVTPGMTNYPNDVDGTLRRMPFRLNGLENFAMAAARLKLGHAPATPPGAKSAWINYPGPTGTVDHVSFADVESGHFDPAAVRGKVVVIGASAPSIGDAHATSTSTLMSGPEIEAAAIQTALDGFPLQEGSRWVDLLLAIALGLVAPLVALIGAQVAFAGDTILAVVPALAAAITGAAGTVLVSNPTRAPWLDRVLDRLSPGRGNPRTRRLRALLLLYAGGFVVLAGLGAEAVHVLRRADLSTVDMRFGIRGPQKPPNAVVVSVEASSITGVDAKGNPRTWPMDRSRHATVIRRLKQAGAAVIAYDVQFTEPSGNDAADNALIRGIKSAAPRVVLSTTEVETGGRTGILGGGAALEKTKANPANGNYVNDLDGSIRRMAFKLDNLETFAMATARVAAGHPIRTPSGNEAWVDYPGPPRTIPFLLFDNVEAGKFKASDVRGKVVVIGVSAPSQQDLHPTSTTGSGLMPGPEIQAAAAGTALAGFPLRSGPGWLDAMLIVVLGAITPFAALRIRRMGATIAIGVGAMAALLVGAQLAFNAGTIVTVVYPLIAALIAILLTAAIHGLTVAFEREQARDAFARFVPEAVVDQVLQDSDGVRLGGVRGEATVMFSDLRGFTSFSETLEPERVIESLNRYLTEMSEAILDHGGTLVAYMGDGIMAVFGAPLKQEDHADRALEAAREMLDRMEGFNGWLREQGLHDGFKMGIGLNSGAVMSGNVGSERRLEYTALGDTTNTAARLEGMTKGTPHQLYVADTTKQRLTRSVDDLVAVGEAEVRGRKAKVLLWSLREGPPPAPQAGESAPSEPVEA
jgi:adenylate cyclase